MIDLAQYIHISLVLSFIFESLFVPDIVTEKFSSKYPTLIKYVDIVNADEKESILKQATHFYRKS